MASGSDFIIKCKTENGAFIVRSLNSESSVEELKMHLSKEIGLKPECIKILSGYPPKALADGTDKLKLKEANIFTGDIVIVEKKIVKSESGDCSSSAADNGKERDADNGKERDADNGKRADNSNKRASGFSDLSGGIMMRHVVPSNNSCLFASVYFVLSHGELDPERSADLRGIIARIVSSDPQKYNAAFLGMQNAEYCAWIQNADHWGGAIELAVLSEHFGVEIVAVDTIHLKMLRFGENSNYSNRIFLIYDGIHYDPLVLELDNGLLQTIFPVNDDRPMEMAMEIAREARSSRQYTDVANFTLRCMVCNERLRGDKEARAHAMESGHIQFGEITK